MSELSRRTPKQEVPTREQIARRAYELYKQRGCEPGREVEDWLAAENELRNQNLVRARPAPAERQSALIGSRQRQSKAKGAAAFDSSRSSNSRTGSKDLERFHSQ